MSQPESTPRTQLKPRPDGFGEPLNTHGTRWKNFYRSLDKKGGNRYEAKCGFCLVTVEGRPDRLHNHVLRCGQWPILEKTLYIQEASKDLAKNVQTKRPREEAPQQQSILGWVSKPMSSEAQNIIDDFLLEAIIYGGIPFRFGDNVFFKKFVSSLCSTYKVPSSETLRGRVLTNMFSKLLGKKLDYLPSFTDYTICFDGWTDVSGNSIYAFMVLKEEREDVLDIIDLSEFRHTALDKLQMKSTDYVASKSSRVPTYHRRGFHPENAGNAHSFRLEPPARSAPTSGFSSPAVSPQRFGSVDVLRSSYSVPREFKISMDRNVVSTSYVLPERFLPSPDHSPLHSPILPSPHQNIRKSSGVARHSPYKSLPGSPAAWPEGYNSSVHPLPRPPGPSSPLHLLNMSHTTNESSTKGQWQKEKLIGRGTYGSVYVAISRNDGAMCAMKEVDVFPSDSKSAECIKQLEQEIKVLQQLDHPNIVQYLGSDMIEDRFCIYLEYVHPGSINNYVREHYRSITESVVRSFTRHILSGLAYLHSTNTIHRDIKGANLLVNSSGVVKLADFGLAKHLTSYAVDLSLKGSPHWMAPEVLLSMMRKDSKPELAFAVDIWSVGCTVIEMLTGKPPWSEYSGVQAMFNVLNRSPAIPETLSAEGKDFLGRCFQRNPADRPTAVMLLDHPFLSNLEDQNRYSGHKLHEKSVSAVDRSRQRN